MFILESVFIVKIAKSSMCDLILLERYCEQQLASTTIVPVCCRVMSGTVPCLTITNQVLRDTIPCVKIAIGRSVLWCEWAHSLDKDQVTILVVCQSNRG